MYFIISDMMKIGVLYELLCISGAVIMSVYCLMKYMKNESVVALNYTEFHASQEDVYPSITICFSNGVFGPFVDTEYIIKTETAHTIKEWGNINNSMFGNISYDDITIGMEDFGANIIYDSEEGDIKPCENKECFKSYGDALQKCFTHDIESMQNNKIYRIKFRFDKEIRNISMPVNIYFHHPGQFLRNGGSPALRSRVLENFNKLNFDITSVTVLRKREDGFNPANSEDDKMIFDNTAKSLNCKSIYPGKQRLKRHIP